MTKAAAREVKYIITLQLLQPFMHTCIEIVMFKKICITLVHVIFEVIYV